MYIIDNVEESRVCSEARIRKEALVQGAVVFRIPACFETEVDKAD